MTSPVHYRPAGAGRTICRIWRGDDAARRGRVATDIRRVSCRDCLREVSRSIWGRAPAIWGEVAPQARARILLRDALQFLAFVTPSNSANVQNAQAAADKIGAALRELGEEVQS